MYVLILPPACTNVRISAKYVQMCIPTAWALIFEKSARWIALTVDTYGYNLAKTVEMISGKHFPVDFKHHSAMYEQRTRGEWCRDCMLTSVV